MPAPCRATSTNSASAPSRNAAVRSGQPRRVEIPVERLDAVTFDDSGVGENAGEAFVVGKAAAEEVPRACQNVLLQEGVGRDRGRKREQGSRGHQPIFRVVSVMMGTAAGRVYFGRLPLRVLRKGSLNGEISTPLASALVSTHERGSRSDNVRDLRKAAAMRGTPRNRRCKAMSFFEWRRRSAVATKEAIGPTAIKATCGYHCASGWDKTGMQRKILPL